MLTTKEHLDSIVCRDLQAQVSGRLLFDVPMSQHTTFGLGGPADAWVEPKDSADLARVLDYCRSNGIAVTVVGQGTNLLVRDGGVRGIVLRLCSEGFRSIRIDGNRVKVGAGMSNTKLLDALKTAGLGGMEFACGIPGCVGGGVAMNAGAHGSSYADWLVEIEVMDGAGRVAVVTRAELDFSYRALRNVGENIILSATLDLERKNESSVQHRVQELLGIRNATQPKGSSPGCVFKNPAGQSAGKLIDSLGLKGTRVGGAWVSDLHGNFILNDRTATSRQVVELIEIVRTQVWQRAGIFLETEVKIIGEP